MIVPINGILVGLRVNQSLPHGRVLSGRWYNLRAATTQCSTPFVDTDHWNKEGIVHTALYQPLSIACSPYDSSQSG